MKGGEWEGGSGPSEEGTRGNEGQSSPCVCQSVLGFLECLFVRVM